jgi:hypothetical protein
MTMAVRTTEDEVRAIAPVEFTETWRPYSHARILDELSPVVASTGMGVIEKQYSLSSDGLNMFASWVLETQINGTRHMVGIRNSMRKSFALGLCSGSYVMVCSNMAFIGDYVEFRRHTKGLTDSELSVFMQHSVPETLKRIDRFAEWHQGLKEIDLSLEAGKILTFDAVEQGIIKPTHFTRFDELYHSKESRYPRSVFGWHEAYTELIRDRHLSTVMDRTNKMHDFLSQYIQVELPAYRGSSLDEPKPLPEGSVIETTAKTVL